MLEINIISVVKYSKLQEQKAPSFNANYILIQERCNVRKLLWLWHNNTHDLKISKDGNGR